MRYKLIIGLCMLFLLVGCSEYTYVCYDERESDTLVEIKISAVNSGVAIESARQQCQEMLSRVVTRRVII